MKVTASIDNFLSAFKRVRRALPTSATMPILEQALLTSSGDAARLHGHNLETTLAVAVEGAEVTGSIENGHTIPVDRFYKTLNTITDTEKQAALEIDDDTHIVTLHLPHRNATYEEPGHPGDDFPDVASEVTGGEFELDAEILDYLLGKTTPFVSDDALRPAMKGVYFKADTMLLQVVATDGHELSWCTEQEDIYVSPPTREDQPSPEISFILRQDAASLAQRLDGVVTITVGEDSIRLAGTKATITTRRIDETYPNFQAVVPDRDNQSEVVTAEVQAFKNAVERTTLFSSDMTNQLRLNFGHEAVELSGEDVERSAEATERVRVTLEEGEGLTIGFNGNYVSEVLGTLGSPKVCLRMDSPNRAAIVEPMEGSDPPSDSTQPSHLMLLMPVMLNSYA